MSSTGVLDDLVLTEFGISLMLDQAVTHLMTPEFLSLNAIVPPNWSAVYPVISSRDLAEVQYNSGLVVRANANEVGFICVVGDGLAETGALCAGVAGSFVERMLGLEYSSVRVDFHGHVMLPDDIPGIVGVGPKFMGVDPVVDSSNRYALPNGAALDFMAREVGRFSEDYIDCVDFSLLTTYVALSREARGGGDWALEVINGWAQPLEYFLGLVELFWGQHVVS